MMLRTIFVLASIGPGRVIRDLIFTSAGLGRARAGAGSPVAPIGTALAPKAFADLFAKRSAARM